MSTSSFSQLMTHQSSLEKVSKILRKEDKRSNIKRNQDKLAKRNHDLNNIRKLIYSQRTIQIVFTQKKNLTQSLEIIKDGKCSSHTNKSPITLPIKTNKDKITHKTLDISTSPKTNRVSHLKR